MELETLIISDQDYVRLSKLGNNGLLADELSRAAVMPSNEMPLNVVRIGSQITYLDEANGVSRNIELVFPEDADFKTGKVSVLSPVGTALLGLKTGQSIDWSFPHGPFRRLKVISVSYTEIVDQKNTAQAT